MNLYIPSLAEHKSFIARLYPGAILRYNGESVCLLLRQGGPGGLFKWSGGIWKIYWVEGRHISFTEFLDVFHWEILA